MHLASHEPDQNGNKDEFQEPHPPLKAYVVLCVLIDKMGAARCIILV